MKQWPLGSSREPKPTCRLKFVDCSLKLRKLGLVVGYQCIESLVCPRLPSAERLIGRELFDNLVITLNLGFGAGRAHNDTRSVSQEISENITARERNRGLGVGSEIVSKRGLKVVDARNLLTKDFGRLSLP